MPESTPAASADFNHCRTVIAEGSKSFAAAVLMLPQALRAPACALYAFCRVADDAVDQTADRLAGLRLMQARLDGVYGRAPRANPIDRALCDTVFRYAIPRLAFDALLEGFAWDVAARRYATLEDVHAYGARVAGSVGVMMAALMGARSAAHFARACDLGVAMQLTNIARDVGEDARAGRLYLPEAWLTQAGLNVPAWLAAPTPHPAITAATLRLLDAADALYVKADAGIAALPAPCRPAIRAARLIYAEIGMKVRACGGDSVSARAVTSTARKLALAGRALAPPRAAALAPAALHAPPLPETAYLVEAALAAPAPALLPTPERGRARSPWARADESWGRVFDLFQDLEHRSRYGPV
jgi:15-cis-phytoene synthase